MKKQPLNEINSWYLTHTQETNNFDLIYENPMISYATFFPEESLNSWLIRSATLNGTSAVNLYMAHQFSCAPRDFDFRLSIKDWKLLSHRCSSKIEITNFEYIKSVVSTTPKVSSSLRPILYYYKDKIFRFCPQCFSDGISYHKLKWRFAFNVACQEHNCWLHTRCPSCKKIQDLSLVTALTFSKNDSKNFHKCLFCNHDLKSLKTSSPPRYVNNGEIFRKQNLFWKIVNETPLTSADLSSRAPLSRTNTIQSSLLKPKIHSHLNNREIVKPFIKSNTKYSELNREKILCYKKLYGDTAESAINEHFEKY